MQVSTSYSVHKLNAAMNKMADKTLQAESGITYARFYFLFVVSQNNNCTQHSIATALGYSDAAVSKMVQEVIHDGLITVITDPAHKRRRLVTLTPAGEDIVAQSITLLDNCFSDVIKAAQIDENTYIAFTERLTTTLTDKIKGEL